MMPPAPLQAAPRIADWLLINKQPKLLVRSGRVELGQGNLTALLQIAADELDVPLEQTQISGGDTHSSPNEGFTSGSLSIPQGGLALRWAASAARRLLLQAAAERLNQPVDQLSIRQGQFFCQEQACALHVWDLAGDIDWQREVVPLAQPKDPSQRHLAGTSLPRIDLATRMMDTPFVHDLALEGMVYGRVLQPPCYGAKLVALDVDALARRAGIIKVWRDGELVGMVAEQAHQLEAAHAWAVQHAQWDLPAVADGDPVAHIRQSREDASVIHETGPAPGTSYATIEHQVTRPYLSHGSIGPSAAVAWWRDDYLQVWSHAQGPYPLRDALATVLDLAPERVHVTHQAGAGCYGHNGADDVALDAALLARCVPGRPVKVIWTRADEFQCAPMAPAMATHIRAQVDAQHQLVHMEVTVNSTPHGNRPGRSGSPNLRAAAFLAQAMPPGRSADIPLANGGGADRNAIPLYDIPAVRVNKRLVHALPYRTSSMRGLGAHLNVYALETLMDRLAADAGQDPFAYRLRHLQDPRARDVLLKLQHMLKAHTQAPAPEGCGWGIGFAKYKNAAAYCAIGVHVEVQDRVRVTHAYAALDGGEIINPDGVINQTEGGMVQAMSWTLLEHMQLDGPRVATESWLDYPILKFSDVPVLAVELINRPELPPLGCAEAAQGPMAAAIGNAVFQVLGVHVHDLPITHDALVAAALASQASSTS